MAVVKAGHRPKLKAGRGVPGICRLRNGGFTLVEILVVLVVIGIALSLAAGRLFVGDAERVSLESERLMAQIESVRDRAAFSGHAVAMRLTDEGVVFLERDPQRVEPRWRTAEAAGLTPLRWHEGIRVQRLDAARDGDELIAFVPSGVTAPFRLRVSLNDNARVIESDALGNLRFAPEG